MNQISLYEAKVANGNGEQTLSRDVYRLGRRFDFFRMLSFYFTTVGFYFSSIFTARAIPLQDHLVCRFCFSGHILLVLGLSQLKACSAIVLGSNGCCFAAVFI